MTNKSIEEQMSRGTKEQQREEETLSAETKKALLSQLENVHSAQERVKLFGKVMDDYGADVLISLIPAMGDASVSVVSACYLLYEGYHIGLSFRDTLKILGYQTADFAVGAIPILGDIADYFFKANKWSAKIFQKHFDKLQKRAIAQGISPADIEKMQINNAKFVKAMHAFYEKEISKKA